MRLGTRRRICIRSKVLSKGKVSFLLLLLLMVTLCAGGSVYFLKIVRPLMMELAKNQATIMAELAIHRSISKLFADTDYSEIVTIHYLEDGTVSAVQSNMGRVNQLKAAASMAITEEIASVDETELSIPLGTLTGYDILAGVGPRLPVKLMPYGNVSLSFENEFTESGINQTLLAVNLTATAHVGIVMPSVNMTSQVVTTMPVTQTVIVGKLPDNYVNIDRMGEDYEGDVLDIIG